MQCKNCELFKRREIRTLTKAKKEYFPAGHCFNRRFHIGMLTTPETNCNSGIPKGQIDVVNYLRKLFGG